MPQYRNPMDLQNVIETIPALVLCALPDATVEFANRAWQEYTGYSPQELSDSGWRSIVHADDVAKFLEEWNIALLAGRPFETEARIRRSDGQYHWFLIKKALAVSGTQNGQPLLRTLIAFEDISDQKQSQIKLQQSEARYRLLIETLSDAVISVSESGTIQFANPATKRIFGYDPNELIGKPLTILMPGHMRKLHEAGFARYLETGRRHLNWQGTELIGQRKNGEEFPMEIALAEQIRNGRTEFTGFARDVSEKKRVEDALRSSEAYLMEAQRQTHTGSCAIDGRSRETVYWSDEMFQIFSFDPQLGPPKWEQFLEQIHWEDREKFKLASDRTFSTKVECDVEFRVVKPDGTVKHIHGIGHPILGPSGQLLQVLGTMVDVTERKRAEEARDRLRQVEADLAHTNRVSTMGELTASLAHEIKQPIGAAVTNAEACLRFIDRDEPDLKEAREAASEMINDARRAAEIIDRVRSLYQKGSSQLETVDVNHVIDEMVMMMEDEATRHAVTIHTDLAQRIPNVMADRVQLQQALMNLMLNGIEATPGTGGELRITSQLAPDGQLLVSISDTGVGIPPENLDRIFNAFFTTKTRGTGLGLPIARSIIQSHGGRVWATANSGPGTTFAFILPQISTAQA